MAEGCECAHKMSLASMFLQNAWEIAESQSKGKLPEWLERMNAHKTERKEPPATASTFLSDYEEQARAMMKNCGLRLKHVYPFNADDEEHAVRAWEDYVAHAKDIADHELFDERTFDMLNEALVVGTECWEK